MDADVRVRAAFERLGMLGAWMTMTKETIQEDQALEDEMNYMIQLPAYWIRVVQDFLCQVNPLIRERVSHLMEVQRQVRYAKG